MSTVDIWLVVGTRRWARLMVTELCIALPVNKKVYIQGDPDDLEIVSWISKSKLSEKVIVVREPLPCPKTLTGVAIVANSAYLHKSSVKEMLKSGYNVVCEKPITFSSQETLGLINLAKVNGLQLFATNTYLFTSYLNNLKNDWFADQQLVGMNIKWTDPASEQRYGENKTYDSSVPLIYDILPHISNIILAAVGELNTASCKINVRRGGSLALLDFSNGRCKTHVKIERNSNERMRTLELISNSRRLFVNFAELPPTFFLNNQQVIEATHSKIQPKPIMSMINSIINFFESNKADSRLSANSAVIGNILIENFSRSYVMQQIMFFSKNNDLLNPINLSHSFKYASKEVESIAHRALPYLPDDCPLRELANVASNSYICPNPNPN